jgi:DNA polymerase type B, organellar and viral
VRGYLSEEVPREKRVPEDKKKRSKKTDWLSYTFVGVDGEGMDVWEKQADGTMVNTGRHIYTYLCAANEHGEVISHCWNADGLTHDEICEVLLAIPETCLPFVYMASYDITMWITALPDEDKYRLLRPETRKIWRCYECHKSWTIEGQDACPHCGSDKFREGSDPIRFNGRAYDFFAGPFTIWGNRDPFTHKWTRKVKLWDVIRFFGSAFVQAIKDWKVGTKEQHDRIEEMKKKRGSFEKETPSDIQKYCQEECTLLAQMMRKVVEGHEEAGWILKAFYGAGSTGKAMLTANDVKAYKGPRLDTLDEDLQRAIMSAFFGGRFEDSMVGTVRQKVWSKDIASAYPYAMTFLPCLACGSWRHVEGKKLMDEIAHAALACVRFEVKAISDAKRYDMAWAPLPFRDESGSICYPMNFSGWAWKPEIMQALLGWHGLVTIHEAWVYDRQCQHEPFAFMPDVYRRRVAIGKEGPGLVLKLGANAGYGVTAQSIGDDPPFQQWAWAGTITSMCRSQALECFRSAKDPWNILTVATDGVTGTEDFHVPQPHETGTRGCRAPPTDKFPDGEIKQPLGGWESEEIDEGMFVAKPGMYFRLNVDLKKLRARGIGRKELFDAKDRVIEGFNGWNRRDYKFSVQVKSRRFYGAKSTIYARSRCDKCGVSWPGVPERLCPQCGSIGGDFEAKRQTRVTDETRKDEGRVDVYGTWGERMIDIRFDPYPKRERKVAHGEVSRLFVRDVEGASSMAYHGQKTPQVLDMLPDTEMLAEQPDVIDDVLDDEGGE